jgi:hypothetical protein
LIRLPPAIRHPEASAIEDWKKVHGRMPQKRNRK